MAAAAGARLLGAYPVLPPGFRNSLSSLCFTGEKSLELAPAWPLEAALPSASEGAAFSRKRRGPFTRPIHHHPGQSNYSLVLKEELIYN